MNILLVRTDRVGDVLLTTPVATALRRAYPDASVTWLVRSYTAPLLEHNPDAQAVLLDDALAPGATLTEVLRRGAFDLAIIAYPRWRAAWATFRAGIPRRIGPASKWYSAFFSDRVWQHRSEGKKNEADYNLDLLAPLGIRPARVPTTLVLTPEERAHARATLDGHRIRFQKPVVVLHPGSGGSSERWPLSHFMALGDRLQDEGCDVVVTSGPGEPYERIMIDQMRRQPVFIPAGSVSLRELASIYSQASLVVTNSTGPLHIGVALDVPTVAVYSPVPTCHPQRWGPYPDYAERTQKHAVLVAAERHGRVRMEEISVDDVWRECEKRLGSAFGAGAA